MTKVHNSGKKFMCIFMSRGFGDKLDMWWWRSQRCPRTSAAFGGLHNDGDADDDARAWQESRGWVGGCRRVGAPAWVDEWVGAPAFPHLRPPIPPPAAPTAAPTFPQPAMQRYSSSVHCTGHWISTSGDGGHMLRRCWRSRSTRAAELQNVTELADICTTV